VPLPVGSIFSLILSLPVLVFFAETCVVTLATIRTIFIARGWKTPAAVLGFFEVSIWLFAIAQVMQHLSSPGCFLAFAGGFALGNYLGVLIEQKLALGNVVVHVISRKQDLMDALRWAGYGVTASDAIGAKGPVRALLTVIPRAELGRVLSIVRSHDRRAFYSVGDLRSAAEGILPASRRWSSILSFLFQRTSHDKKLVFERIRMPSPTASRQASFQESE
jgi:uncharacterized protein YebE (UPF0316 family)